MKQKVLLLVSMLFAVQSAMWACTNLIVGKKASTDGSVIVSYSADSFGSFGFMCRYPAGKHPKGTEQLDLLVGQIAGDKVFSLFAQSQEVVTADVKNLAHL